MAQTKVNILEIIAILEQTYGSPRHGNKEDPLDELIYIKLSQQTNAPKFRPIYETLQARYPGWRGLEEAPVADIEEILRPGGFHRQRAKQLKAMAAQIMADRGELNLVWLRDETAEDAIAYLCDLPGVGIKSAYCVAMYSLRHNVLPVDIHVQRISERLGLLPQKLSDEKKHQTLSSLIPADKRYSYHVNCVSHGRIVCRKVPKCDICNLQAYCCYFQSHN